MRQPTRSARNASVSRPGSQDILHELTRIGIELQQLHDESEIFETMGERLFRLGHRCVIYEVNGNSLAIRYMRVDPQRRSAVEKALGRPMVGLTLPLDEITRQALETRQPRFVEHFDARAFADSSAGSVVARQAVGLRGIRVPITLDRPGVLLVFGEEVSPDWVDAIGLFASGVACAMQNARHYAELRRRVQELTLLAEVSQLVAGPTDQMLASAARQVAQLVDASNAFFMLLDETRQRLVGVAATPPFHETVSQIAIGLDETALSARCFRENRPQTIEDTQAPGHFHGDYASLHGQRALLALPMRSRKGLIGVLLLGDTRGPRKFTAEEIERAATLVNQVAVAIENALLYEDQRRSYEKLTATQAELLRRERLAALGELSAIVAHEVRNPLAAIFNAINALRRMLKLEGDGARLVEIVTEEADHLNRLVANLLDFARPSEPAFKPVSIEEVIDEAILSASRELGAQVAFERRFAPDLPPVRVDRHLIRRALVNVAANAVQAMPSGGRVLIEAAPDSDERGRAVRIDISDEGPGIPPDLSGRVFEPFFTTKASGTGLGLAVVKRIVEDHRGEVAIRNRAPPDRGATVTIRLPLQAPT